MAIFELDLNEGPHIASKLSDKQLAFLHQVVAVELAIRLARVDYIRRFHDVAEHRTEMDEIVSDWRNQRDRMMFVESVKADLEQLLVLSEAESPDAA
ncbi:MAG TPA: hypothetical protein VFP42_07690 [Acidimicrobiia bacterium]|nr:hypothetical protein [Acidimicrobiia bacterium]